MSAPYLDPEVTRAYRVLAAPAQFAPPAAHLIQTIGPAPGTTLLDVGAGTGIIAETIHRRLGDAVRVVGVDASIAMLREGRRAFTYSTVVGRLPALPFATDAFDAATASFVISHLLHYTACIEEIVRVCRPGGRLGVTAWGALPNRAAQLWTDTAVQFVPRPEFERAVREHLPWDVWFSDPNRITEALETAGLTNVVVHTRTFPIQMTTRDFLTSREASVQGTVIRERLPAEGWQRFRERLLGRFESTFGGEMKFDRDVHFGVALKSAGG